MYLGLVIIQYIFSFGLEPKLTLQKNAVLTIELRELIKIKSRVKKELNLKLIDFAGPLQNHL